MSPNMTSIALDTPLPRLRLWSRVLLFGLAYVGCAVAGNALSLKPGPFVTIWLPSGLFLGTLLLHPRRDWPAFILAAGLANLTFDLHHGQAWYVSLLFFLGNGLEAGVGAWLVQHQLKSRPTLDSLGDAGAFFVGALLIGPALSAAVGSWVVTALLGGGSYGMTWLTWFSGDALGIALLAPLGIAWKHRNTIGNKASGLMWGEVLYLCGVALAGVLVFNDPWHHDLSLKYLMIPGIVFGAIRYGLRGATAASLIVAVIAAWMTVHGLSHLSASGLPLREQAVALQLFLAVAASSGLVTAALLSERRQAEERLREAYQFSQRIIDNAREGIIVYGPDLRYRVWNPFMETMSGYAAEEVLGRHPEEVFPVLRQAGVMDRLERVLAGKSVDVVDFPFEIPGKGKPGWSSDSVAPLLNAEGEIIGVIGTVRDITERKAAEIALQESEQRLELATTAAKLGVWDWDVQTGAMVWNDRMFELYGVTPDTVKGNVEDWKEGVHPDDLDRAIAACEAALQGLAPFDAEFRVRHRDGTVLWIKGDGKVLRDEAGKALRMIGLNRDITAVKVAEAALRESEERFNRAFQFMPVALGITTLEEGRFLAVNKAFESLYGFSAHEVTGRCITDFPFWADPGDREAIASILEREGSLEGREVQILRKDGSPCWISYSGRSVSMNNLPCLLSAAIDITEQKIARERIEKRIVTLTQPLEGEGISFEELFDREEIQRIQDEFAAATGVASIITTPEGLPLTAPSQFTRLCSELIRKTERGCANCFKSDAALGCYQAGGPRVQPCLSGGLWDAGASITVGGRHVANWLIGQVRDETQTDEQMKAYAREIGLDEAAFLEAFHAVPAMSQERFQQIAQALYSLSSQLSTSAYQNIQQARFIAERKRAEEEKSRLQAQLMQAQKMESLGSLAGGVAHDMNNVLGAILGMATASIQAQAPGSPTHRAFDTIIQAATRGGKMVKSLLSFARQSPVEERDVDLNEVLREETRMLERTTLAKVQLEMDLAPDLRMIRGDASALTHVFMNLCVNAVDAMPEQGVITLRTRNVGADGVEVEVVDTGTGMSKEVLEKATDPFFTTKEVGKGTGLGLSMVYRTVQAHHGRMTIQSELGKGTRVTLHFPARAPRIAEPEPTLAPAGSAVRKRLTVLVVDDDELVRTSMEALLGLQGHHAVLVASGEAALADLKAGLTPDVVILDMNMPGLGGAGTLPALRALRPNLPVLLATGRVDQSATNLVAAHSQVFLLAKPFNAAELQRYFDEVVPGG